MVYKRQMHEKGQPVQSVHIMVQMELKSVYKYHALRNLQEVKTKRIVFVFLHNSLAMSDVKEDMFFMHAAQGRRVSPFYKCSIKSVY